MSTPEPQRTLNPVHVLIAGIVLFLAIAAVVAVFVMSGGNNTTKVVNSRSDTQKTTTVVQKATPSPSSTTTPKVVVVPNTTTAVVPNVTTTTPAPSPTPTRYFYVPNTTDTAGNLTMYSGSNISDPFARAVLTAAADYYRAHGTLPDGTDLAVHSPTTDQTYPVSYSNDGTTTTCYNMTAGATPDNMIQFDDSLANGTGAN